MESLFKIFLDSQWPRLWTCRPTCVGEVERCQFIYEIIALIDDGRGVSYLLSHLTWWSFSLILCAFNQFFILYSYLDIAYNSRFVSEVRNQPTLANNTRTSHHAWGSLSFIFLCHLKVCQIDILFIYRQHRKSFVLVIKILYWIYIHIQTLFTMNTI